MLFDGEGIEPCSFFKGLFLRQDRFFLGYAYGEKTYQLVFIGNVKYLSHFVADIIIIGDVALVPAALIAKLDYCKEHIFNGCGIILNCEAFISISIYPSGQDAYCGRCRFTYGGIYHALQLFQYLRVVYCDKACGLLIAAGGSVQTCFHNGNKVLSRNGNRLIFSSVAVSAANYIYCTHICHHTISVFCQYIIRTGYMSISDVKTGHCCAAKNF